MVVRNITRLRTREDLCHSETRTSLLRINLIFFSFFWLLACPLFINALNFNDLGSNLHVFSCLYFY